MNCSQNIASGAGSEIATVAGVARIPTRNVLHPNTRKARALGTPFARSATFGIGHLQRGFTLIELIVATTILLLLSTMALPIARFAIQRQRERELREDLWMMRDAIDRYKDASDKGAFQIKVGSDGYPPDLQTLVDGVDVAGKKLKFLRRIPVDPMTGKAEWGMHSMQDDPTSDSWDEQNLFDVYSKSQGTALDGSKYRDW